MLAHHLLGKPDAKQMKVNAQQSARSASKKRKKRAAEPRQRIAVPSVIRQWIVSAYVFINNRNACVKKEDVYQEYLRFCDHANMQPANKAVFGKMVNQTFDNKLQTRRLGCRGNSESYYQFLVALTEVQRRRQEAILMPSPCANREELTDLFNDLKFSYHTPRDFAGSAAERTHARLQSSPRHGVSPVGTPMTPASSPYPLSFPSSPSSSDCELGASPRPRKRSREAFQESSDDDEYISKNSPGDCTESEFEEQYASESDDPPAGRLADVEPFRRRFDDHKRRRCEESIPEEEIATPVQPESLDDEDRHQPQPRTIPQQQAVPPAPVPAYHPCSMLVHYRFDPYGNLQKEPLDDATTTTCVPDRIPPMPADVRTPADPTLDIWYNCVTAGISSTRRFYSPPASTYAYLPGIGSPLAPYGAAHCVPTVTCCHRIFPSSARDACRAPAVTMTSTVADPRAFAASSSSSSFFFSSQEQQQREDDSFLLQLHTKIESTGYVNSLYQE